jgi:hypothetical protein
MNSTKRSVLCKAYLLFNAKNNFAFLGSSILFKIVFYRIEKKKKDGYEKGIEIRNNMPVLMPDNHLLDLKNDIPKA